MQICIKQSCLAPYRIHNDEKGINYNKKDNQNIIEQQKICGIITMFYFQSPKQT